MSQEATTSKESLAQLRQLLVDHFNEKELRDLCFDLKIDYESLPAEGKASKARELVAYLERHDRLSVLLEVGQHLRPDVDWARVYLDDRLDDRMADLRSRRDEADRKRREMRERQRVVNLRPLDMTHTFKDRLRETRALGDHLVDSSVRLVSVVGRGGMGKTALVSRVLANLEQSTLPVLGEEQEFPIKGILYLSSRSTGLGLERIYADVGKMLGEPMASRLAARWAGRDTLLATKVEYLLEALADGLYILLLDNLEDSLNEEGDIIEEGLRLFIERCLIQPSGARLVITSREQVRITAEALASARMIYLREGLPEDEAVALLRDLDPQGEIGLRDASEANLRRAARLTQGIPRALELLAGILDRDPSASLPRLLADERIFGMQVVEKLVAEGHRRMKDQERRVMEALAVFDRPTEETAVAYLLHPWFPGLDVRSSLYRLTSGYFVTANRTTGEYSLHPLDREYAYCQLPDPPAGDGEPDGYTRRNLELRAAHFYASIQKPEIEWKTIDDLVPQLVGFEHCVRAEDFDGACRVLHPIDYNNLYLWGHYARLVEMRKKLQGRLTDSSLKVINSGGLGFALQSMGRSEEGIRFAEQAVALAREIGDRRSEGFYLEPLGDAYRILGHVERAIELYGDALVIARERGDRLNESVQLGDLALAYRTLGQTERAIDLYEQALTIAREIGDRRLENNWLGHSGRAYYDLGQFERATQLYQEALIIAQEIGDRRREGTYLSYKAMASLALGQIEEAVRLDRQSLVIAREINNLLGESYQLLWLGRALLASKSPTEARQYCEEALTLNIPETSYQSALMLGIALLHQGETAAGTAFGDAAARCLAMLEKTPGLYAPRYALATALVGSTVCVPGWNNMQEDRQASLLAPALDEYQRALSICAAQGVVREAIFDLELICAVGINGLKPVFKLLQGHQH